MRGLLRDGVYQVHSGWGGYWLRLVLATAGMAAVLLWLNHDTAHWLAWEWPRRATQMSLLCLAGAGTYLAIHIVLGTRLRHLRTPSRL
jgi:putative peptidoglycan lipid II flippase